MTPFVEYFRSFGEISDPQEYGSLFSDLPDDPGAISKTIQGLIIHPLWCKRYGVKLDEERIDTEQQARTTVEILKNILRLDDAPLSHTRSPEKRTVGTCRNFSLLMCSILRSKQIPARLRCGFATYFQADHFEDHWICEYWSASEKYWARVDPQLDDLHMESLQIDFDPCDVPIDAYLYAGEAWTMCRRGRTDPADFGFGDMSGMGFIKGNIVRDILALNKIETLPWDHGWGVIDRDYLREVDRAEYGYIDRLARCSANSLVHLAHSFFKDDEKIRLPKDWDFSMAPTISELRRTSSSA